MAMRLRRGDWALRTDHLEQESGLHMGSSCMLYPATALIQAPALAHLGYLKMLGPLSGASREWLTMFVAVSWANTVEVITPA